MMKRRLPTDAMAACRRGAFMGAWRTHCLRDRSYSSTEHRCGEPFTTHIFPCTSQGCFQSVKPVIICAETPSAPPRSALHRSVEWCHPRLPKLNSMTVFNTQIRMWHRYESVRESHLSACIGCEGYRIWKRWGGGPHISSRVVEL